MAEIISARYTAPDNSGVEALLDNGRRAWIEWPGNSSAHRRVADWIASGGTIAPYEKSAGELKNEMGVEAEQRITAQVPAWNSRQVLEIIESIWNMLGPENAEQDMARQIFQYAKQSAAKVDGLTPAEVALVVASDDLPFAAVDGADLGWPDTRP